MKKYKKHLFEKHDAFDMTSDQKMRLLLRDEIKEIVETQQMPDAQDFHILGLVFYDTSDIPSTALSTAHDYFRKSLIVDPEYNMARLYSAHCYHDKGDIQEALTNYLAVDKGALTSEFALWRTVKLKEQIGYCLFKLCRVQEALNHFEEVLGFYESEPLIDLVNPVEVYHCLDKSHPIYQRLKTIEYDYYQR